MKDLHTCHWERSEEPMSGAKHIRDGICQESITPYIEAGLSLLVKEICK